MEYQLINNLKLFTELEGTLYFSMLIVNYTLLNGNQF